MKNIITPEEVKAYIGNYLYGFNGCDILAWAWNSQMNTVFYGPGGYGKTDAAVHFFYFLKSKGELRSQEKPFVLGFGQGMTPEKLFNGIDLKAFKDQGEIRYNIEKAFVNSEYVIFEELFDASLSVLLELKDVLQSGYVKQGEDWIPIKTKFIIACTNRSRDEVVTDNSTAALLERFVYEREIVWSSWSYTDYLESLCVATGTTPTNCSVYHKIVAKACAKAADTGIKTSPRTAGKALKAMQINSNPDVLSGFYGLKDFKKYALEGFQISLDDEKQKKEIADMLAEVKDIAGKAKYYRSAIKIALEAKYIYEKFISKEIKLRDGVIATHKSFVKDATQELSILWTLAQSLVHNPPKNSIAWQIKHKPHSKFDWDLLDHNHKRKS